MKNTVDYKSRFRILKGGKISLVVSALLVSGTLITPAQSAALEFSNDSNATYNLDGVNNSLKITVDGNISTSGSNDSAIELVGNLQNNYITNNGILKADESSVSIYRSIIDGNITNSGTIESLKSGISIGDNVTNGNIINNIGATISAKSAGVAALGISMQEMNNSKVENAGTIDVEADNYAFGIFAPRTISNSTIKNAGTISAISRDGKSYGIKTKYLSGSSSIENAGTINSTVVAGTTVIPPAGNYGRSTGINVNLADNSTITNSGTINVLADADAYNSSSVGIYVGSGEDITITNTDTIKADVAYSGYQSASIGIKVGNIRNSTITNSGTITATMDGKAGYSAHSIKTGHSAQVTVENTGTLNGNIYMGSDSAINNAGIVSLPNRAKAFVGSFTNKADGILELGLEIYDGKIEHASLSVNYATFESGSTINVNVLDTLSDVKLLAGTTLNNVVSASTNLTIDGTLNITDNSVLIDFEHVEDGNNIDLKIVEGSSILDSTIAGKGNNDTVGAATALDKIQDGDFPEMDNVFEKLTKNASSSDEAVAKAVEGLTPAVASATVGASSQISNGIQGIVEMRQNANLGGLNSGDTTFSDKNLWIKPFGSLGKQNDKDGINGFNVNAYGIGMGIDAEYKDRQRIGAALFYTKANVDVNNMNQNANLDVVTALIYGNTPVIDDKTNFLYQLGYSWQKTNTDRTLFTSEVAKSEYTSKVASLDIKLMRDYKPSNSWSLQPMVELTYRRIETPSHSESGAGAANLSSEKSIDSEFIASIGAISHYKVTNNSNFVSNLNIGYDVLNKGQRVTSSFQGAAGVSFDTDGIDNGRWNYDIGLGYEMDIDALNNINFMFNHQGQGRDFQNNTISAKYVLKF